MIYSATAVSAQALNLLSSSCRGLTLHSVFQHVINIRAGNRIISVQDNQCAFTPLSIQTDTASFLHFSEEVQRHHPIIWAEQSTNCGHVSINIGNCAVIDCQLSAGGSVPPRDVILSFIPLLAKPQSLAFCSSSTLYQSLWETSESQRYLYEILNQAALCSTARSRASALNRMLGVGPGLTPSGDDFLVGLLASLYYRSDEPDASELLMALKELLSGADSCVTTEISMEFIYYAEKGFFSLPMHQLFACGCNRAHLLSAVAALVRYGATSGSDTLGGVVYGLSL